MDEIEIPVLLKTPSAPDGTIAGVGKFAGVFNRVYSTVLTNPWVIAAMATLVFFKKAIDFWWKQDASLNSMNLSLVNQGIYTKNLSKSYQEMALSIQEKTQFADEEVMAAQASLQSYMGEKKITQRVMMAVADFASRNGGDLAMVADLIGRTISSSDNHLQRYGIEIDEHAKGAERLSQALRGIESKWGGQARASVQGLGAIKQMKNSLSSVMEKMGSALTPFVVYLARSITELAVYLQNSSVFLNGITLLGNGFNVASSAFKAVMSAISESLSITIRAAFDSAALTLEGNFDDAFDAIKQGRFDVVNAVKNKKEQFVEDMSAILEKEEADKQARNNFNEKVLANEKSRTRIAQEDKRRELEIQFNTDSQKELIQHIVTINLQKDQRIIEINRKLKAETNNTKKLELQAQKRKIAEDEYAKLDKKYSQKENDFALIKDQNTREMFERTLNILASLQHSKYEALIIAGKAAAIAKVVSDTVESVSATLRNMIDIFGEEVGPILGAIIGGILAIWAAELIAEISGVSLFGKNDPSSTSSVQIDNASLWGEVAKALAITIFAGTINRVMGYFLGGYKFVKPGDFVDDFQNWMDEDRKRAEAGDDGWYGPGDSPGERMPGPGGTPTNPEAFGVISGVNSSSRVGTQVNVTIRGGLAPTRSMASLIAKQIQNRSNAHV